MEDFDAVQWHCYNDITLGFSRVTCFDVEMLQKSGGAWNLSQIKDYMPGSEWIAGTPYVCAENSPDKDKILKNVIDRKIETLDIKSGWANLGNRGRMPFADTIYMMRSLPYSLMVDANTGFFKVYRYLDGHFKGDDMRMATHFKLAQNVKQKERCSGVTRLPYGAAREFIACALKFAIETSEKKKWFAHDLHNYMLWNTTQYKK